MWVTVGSFSDKREIVPGAERAGVRREGNFGKGIKYTVLLLTVKTTTETEA